MTKAAVPQLGPKAISKAAVAFTTRPTDRPSWTHDRGDPSGQVYDRATARPSGQVSTNTMIRGMLRIDPLMRRPCGIHIDEPQKGRSCRDLLNEGCTHHELRYNWGFNSVQLADAGLSASEQAEIGVPTLEIAGTGRYKVEECKAANCSVMDMLSTTKYTPSLLIKGGYGPMEFRQAGLTPAAIRGLGFTAAEMLAAGVDTGGLAYMRPPPSAARSRGRAGGGGGGGTSTSTTTSTATSRRGGGGAAAARARSGGSKAEGGASDRPATASAASRRSGSAAAQAEERPRTAATSSVRFQADQAVTAGA